MGIVMASERKLFNALGAVNSTKQARKEKLQRDRLSPNEVMVEQKRRRNETNRIRAMSNKYKKTVNKINTKRNSMTKSESQVEFNKGLFEELKCRWVHSVLYGSTSNVNNKEKENETYCVGNGSYCDKAKTLFKRDGSTNFKSDTFKNIQKYYINIMEKRYGKTKIAQHMVEMNASIEGTLNDISNVATLICGKIDNEVLKKLSVVDKANLNEGFIDKKKITDGYIN